MRPQGWLSAAKAGATDRGGGVEHDWLRYSWLCTAGARGLGEGALIEISSKTNNLYLHDLKAQAQVQEQRRWRTRDKAAVSGAKERNRGLGSDAEAVACTQQRNTGCTVSHEGKFLSI